MSATKTTPVVKITSDATEMVTAKGFGEALQAALQLIPEYFPGTAEVNVDAYSEPEVGSEVCLAFELHSPFERVPFKMAMRQYFYQLRRENNPIFLYLTVINR